MCDICQCISGMSYSFSMPVHYLWCQSIALYCKMVFSNILLFECDIIWFQRLFPQPYFHAGTNRIWKQYSVWHHEGLHIDQATSHTCPPGSQTPQNHTECCYPSANHGAKEGHQYYSFCLIKMNKTAVGNLVIYLDWSITEVGLRISASGLLRFTQARVTFSAEPSTSLRLNRAALHFVLFC